ncbi:DUF3788 family protein [Alkaliphilus pronyensis]|uniref:DUF3788 family protein n=1 Tax=Alkaliphilus pronyensis TaxID=1482732 RepID=A0A6I0FCR2_9FIRM|nr:DUF3788 family protein [Alkaliphilus pronyensis]KAB3535735.1 DUF3788 family protein [Alkaliphilus pronyensis]
MEAVIHQLFCNPDIYPNEDVLKHALCKNYENYQTMLKIFDYHGLDCEWRYYNDGKAWLCKVVQNKRTIVWVSIWTDYIKTGFYFSPKHIYKVRELDISDVIKGQAPTEDKIKKFNEIVFEINDMSLLADLEKVIKLKIQCK